MPPILQDEVRSEAKGVYRRSYWPLAVVVIFITGAATYLIHDLIVNAARIAQAPAKMFEGFRQDTYNTKVHTAIGEIRAVKRLVIATVPIDVEVTREHISNTLWGKLYLGTTSVRLKAEENKVQFYVPLEDLRPEDFNFDQSRGVLFVSIPRPVVDEEIVGVQTDPSKIEIKTDVGWASLDRYDGQFVRDQARAELKPQIVAEAVRNKLVQGYVMERGRKVFEEEFADRLSRITGQKVITVVRYRDER